MAGLRPYRAGGFRVESEVLGDKQVIHCYGHGGAGITLSWGTAQLVVEQSLTQPHRQAAVIGCGIAGLTAARLLQENGFSVTIYARDLPPNTTSDVAGAIWLPYSVVSHEGQNGAFANGLLKRALHVSWDYFQTHIGEYYGVSRLPLYLLSDDSAEELPWDFRISPEQLGARRLEPYEHPFECGCAWRMETLLIEPDVYLPALMTDVRQNDGDIILREFQDQSELLALDEPLIVNCTGIGAKTLFNDEELTPVRGRLVVLEPQPDVKYVYIAGDSYMIPRKSGLLLGGTYEPGESSLEPDAATTARILEGNRRVVESMKSQYMHSLQEKP